jgi:hypothetical protein
MKEDLVCIPIIIQTEISYKIEENSYFWYFYKLVKVGTEEISFLV